MFGIQKRQWCSLMWHRFGLNGTSLSTCTIRRDLASDNKKPKDVVESSDKRSKSTEEAKLKQHVQKITEYYSQYKFGEQHDHTIGKDDASRGEEYVLTDDYGLGGVPFDQDDIHVNRELFPISLQRPAGPDVIPLADICKLLKAENASDVCVIAVPPDASYCDYMVIASMISTKHVSAVASKTRKIYRRRMQPGDMSIGYEGHFAASKIFNTMRKQQHRNNDWVALDMGRIVLHLMLSETRCKMDLESLWLLGAEHDDHTQAANNMEQVVDDVEKEQPVDWDSYYMADNAEKEKQKQLYAQWLKQQQ